MSDSENGHRSAATSRIAAVGDLHCTVESGGRLQELFTRASAEADVIALCGDLTDYGLPEEAHILVNELARTVKIPILAVLGNHDFESGKQAEVEAILAEAGVVVLDGGSHEIGEVGFVGVKGFCGGFGRRTLEPWGEPMIKEFVREAVNEGMKLESGLARLRTAQRVALLHYAPIEGTVAGEPPEIFPFLGSSRLEEPLNRYAVAAVFHGHAHRGAPEGRTREGIPVYNVAAPLLRRLTPEAPPFRIVAI
ncbi:MAG: metallophosphoesterase [Chloroflexi bacterium]|nr:MAG: metallophosphoesterase [Chloroflexota bacterium]